jgi:hypothetical protein
MIMNMTIIREQAKAMGIPSSGKMRKADLIRAIQSKEGNQPCFEADWRANCQEMHCSWRAGCLASRGR